MDRDSRQVAWWSWWEGRRLATAPKLLAISVDGLPKAAVDLPPELLQLQSTPIEKIYEDLDSYDTHKKGVALELLSLRLMRDLGLRPVRFRERAQDTGGGEVDLIVDGVHLHYSRWLCQCKNTPNSSVRVEALAKEIGMAVLLQAQVIVLVTRGRFTSYVSQQARQLAATSALQAVLIDGQSLLRPIGLAGHSRSSITCKRPPLTL